jgi:hypothetical protein
MMQCIDEQALVWVSFDNRWTAIAPFEQSSSCIEPKAAFLLRFAMAFYALANQYRSDLPLELCSPFCLSRVIG